MQVVEYMYYVDSLGTIQILRKQVFGLFLCTDSQQKWPFSEPTHPVQ